MTASLFAAIPIIILLSLAFVNMFPGCHRNINKCCGCKRCRKTDNTEPPEDQQRLLEHKHNVSNSLSAAKTVTGFGASLYPSSFSMPRSVLQDVGRRPGVLGGSTSRGKGV